MQKVIYPEHLEFSMDNDSGFLQANAFEDLEAYTFLILVRVRKGGLTLDIGHDTRVSYVIKRKRKVYIPSGLEPARKTCLDLLHRARNTT